MREPGRFCPLDYRYEVNRRVSGHGDP
jgi:hypothetical protein